MRSWLFLLRAGISVLLVIRVTNAADRDSSLNCADLRPTLRAAAGVLFHRYVMQEMGKRGAVQIDAAARRKEDYVVCGDAEVQASKLTQIIRAAIPDLHLRVASGAPPNKEDPSALSKVATEPDDHGIVEVSRLADGVGYLRLSEFDDVRSAEPRLKNAMALVADVKGLVIDLRGNPGGDGNTADLILRSFLPPNAPITLIKIDREGRPVSNPIWELSWPLFPAETKVVILIDRGSASAAEALAFGLREENRATIVGSRSLGAAHIVDNVVGLPGNFSLSLPEFRLVGRKSGKDWERTGVTPDIAATGRDALLRSWEAAK